MRVPVRAVVAIQAELIAEHGGLSGPPRAGDLTEDDLARWIEANSRPSG